MFERFTDRSRRSVVLAQEHARMLGHAEIDSGHLVIGLAAEGDSVAARALAALGLDADEARAVMGPLLERSDPPPAGPIPFTPRCKRALENALREALQLGHAYIGTEHLLLALIREATGTAAQILDALGITDLDVRAKVMELLRGYETAAVPVPVTVTAAPTDLPSSAVPATAYIALGAAIQAYEPEAAALLARSPSALLQVLLEAGRRVAVSAGPAIRAAERARIRLLAERHAAIYSECGGCCDSEDNPDHRKPFADLIGEHGD